MFRGMSVQQFNKKFATDEDCRKYLFDIKWRKGYQCRKCRHEQYYKGETLFHMRCRSCDYDESVTAGTLFHKIKFPLIKAFGIAFAVCVRKKGMSTLELARKFGIRQTTAWLFKRKLQEAMKNKNAEVFIANVVEVLEIIVSGSDKSMGQQRQRSTPKVKIVFSSDKNQRLQGHAFPVANAERSLTNPDSIANLHRLKKKFSQNFRKQMMGLQTKGKRSANKQDHKNFGDIILMNLHNWLNGIHHHCSERFLMDYLNEFFFRFNRRDQLKNIFHCIIEQIMAGQPYFHKPSRSKWLVPIRSKATHP